MIRGNELALDAAQLERAQTRAAAIRFRGEEMGHKFIALRLERSGFRMKRVSGVDVLHATPFADDEMGGVTNYAVELRGGEMVFELVFGQYRYDMVDTEHNRRFLASHYDYGFWSIVNNPELDADIQKRADEMRAELKRRQAEIDRQRRQRLADLDAANEPTSGSNQPQTQAEEPAPKYQKKSGRPKGRKTIKAPKPVAAQQQDPVAPEMPPFGGAGMDGIAGIGRGVGVVAP